MKIFEIKDVESLKTGHPHLHTVQKAYIVDDTYRVYIAYTEKYTHIRIRRLDNQPIHCFSDFQAIKNEFLGKETEAIEVFPKVSNYIDNSNTYHLFSWPDMKVPNLKELYEYI